jgi:hypothetical protein
LKIGTEVVGNAPRGERLIVSAVQGPWLGTSIHSGGGRVVSGWILMSDASPAE